MLRDEQYDCKGDLLRVVEHAYIVDRAGADYLSPGYHSNWITMWRFHHAWTVDTDHRTYCPFAIDESSYGRPLLAMDICNPLQLLKEEEWRQGQRYLI